MSHLINMAEYTARLTYHDWHYQYSDDHRVWEKGNNNYLLLLKLREQLDPDWQIWNSLAPEGYKHGEAKEEKDNQT